MALRQVSTVCCAGLKGAGGKSGASGKQGTAGRQKVYWVVVEAGCWVVRPQAVAGRARSLESQREARRISSGGAPARLWFLVCC